MIEISKFVESIYDGACLLSINDLQAGAIESFRARKCVKYFEVKLNNLSKIK